MECVSGYIYIYCICCGYRRKIKGLTWRALNTGGHGVLSCHGAERSNRTRSKPAVTCISCRIIGTVSPGWTFVALCLPFLWLEGPCTACVTLCCTRSAISTCGASQTAVHTCLVLVRSRCARLTFLMSAVVSRCACGSPYTDSFFVRSRCNFLSIWTKID